MTKIRAFVGHSFVDDDAGVIGKFLLYFDQLSKSSLDFSWEHAEAAEPKALAEKVMRLMSDKDVFVGSCTRRERAISPASLKPTLLRSNVLKAQEKEFSLLEGASLAWQ